MTELLRLPEIPEGPAEVQLAAMKTYLYRLSEQLQYILSTQQQEWQSDRENVAGLEKRLAASPRLAQQTLALAGRQFRGNYVPYDAYEQDRQRQETVLWENRERLNTAPADRQEEETPVFRAEEGPGYQAREGRNIRFTAFGEPESCLRQVFAGRWQLE